MALSERERIARFQQAEGLLRATLVHKSGCPLNDDDPRPENQQLIDLYYELRARVWESLADESLAEPTHFKAYVRRCAANAWVDHLRSRYPMRLSLRNRLQYFVKTHPQRFTLQRNAEDSLELHRPPGAAAGAADTDLRRLRERPASWSGRGRPAMHWTKLQAADWARLLDALIDDCGQGLDLEDLVSVLVVLLDVREDTTESLTEADDDEGPARQIADEFAPDPQDHLVMRDAMARAWQAIRALKPEHRAALLLNPPTVGTRPRPGGALRGRTAAPAARAEVDVFPMLGIASVSEIGRALPLGQAQFDAAWSALEISDQERERLGALTDDRERFAALWQHLPMPDATIAKVLAWENPQQVINRRAQACEQIKRQLAGLRSLVRR